MDLKKNAPKGEFLAYINKEEAAMLKKAGGSGKLVNGIPSFRPQDYGQEARAKGTYGFSKQDVEKAKTDKSNPYSQVSQKANQDFNDRIQRNREIREDIKKRELEKNNYVKQKPFQKAFDVAGSVFDFGKNYLRNRKKGIYNVVGNNPKNELQFLSKLQITDPAKYNSLPQNLKDLLENTQYDMSGSFKDQPKFSYDDFESLTQFDDGAFAQYAKDIGSPGLSVAGDMSKVGIKSVRRDEFGNPVKDMFGQTLFDYGDPTFGGGGGGGQNLLPLNYGAGAGPVEEEKETQTFEFDSSRFGKGGDSADVTRASYIFNQGGRVPRNMGGIMNAVPRQGYFLGKIVKGVKKVVGGVADAAGKVLKSDVGKMALLAAGTYYAGGGNLFGMQRATDLGRFSFGQIPGASFLMGGGKDGKYDGGFNPFKVGALGLGALSLFGNKAAPNEDNFSDRGGRLKDSQGNEVLPSGIRKEIDEAYESGDAGRIKEIESYYAFLPPRNQYLPYPNYAVGGRVAAQEGGLMNLGGMEKDYRAEGGFVPIGKQEKADDVPARLSVNEFVFTADAVRNAGGGDIDRGAEVMENMMKNLEKGGTVSEESQGNTGAQDMFSVSERIGEII